MKLSKSATLAVVASLACLPLFTGCASDDNVSVTGDYARAYLLSPEMEGLASTQQQRMNVNARVIDSELRQIPDDINYLLLLDRPIVLSQYPQPWR